MNTPEAVQPLHLSRLAIIYVRQSSLHQSLVNQESLRLQYDLQYRAVAVGWKPDQVRIIDADLGRTGRNADGRQGFQELVALVNQEQVGVIFAYDVTRLSRNCRDWYQLLDLCSFRQCLVADQDTVYDPGTPNGRLLLGLKGLLSEFELHTIQSRLTAGLLNKAKRGELAQRLPIGLVRNVVSKQVVKHSNQEVQSHLELVFTTFLRVKTATAVVACLAEQQLLLPRRGDGGELVWRKPSLASVLDILKNPAYAGAFVYGRTRTKSDPSKPNKRGHQMLPMDQWKIRVPDRYPAYISWEMYEKIQDMIRDNHSEYENKQSRGVARCGKALLHGLVYCGECGHKMVVQYKKEALYCCKYLRKQYQAPICQRVSADPIDTYVTGAFFEALSPTELDLYDKAIASLEQDEQEVQRTQQQQLERLRYQARLAQKQFDLADPDNRLVASVLEKRWEAALQELKNAEEETQRRQNQPPVSERLSNEEKQAFLEAGKNIPDAWRQGKLSVRQQKEFLRCLVSRVILHRSVAETISIRIVWRGGDTTTTNLPVAVGAFARLSTAEALEKEIVELAKEGKRDEEIAKELTSRGYRSARDEGVRVSTVRIIRLRHRVLRKRSQSHPQKRSGYLSVSQIASRLNIPRSWIYDRIHNGTIEIARDAKSNRYLFPDKPKTITQFKQLWAGNFNKLRF